jgi:hypothetical protein
MVSLRSVVQGLSVAAALCLAACQNGSGGASELTPATEADKESALTSSQQCLHQASNADLIAELSSRLQSGPTNPGGAVASYSCDSSAQLNISVVSPTGAEHTAQVYVGNGANCQAVMQTLNRNRHSIATTELIAVCDSSAQVNRFSVTPDGNLQTLSSIYVGNMDQCLAQANQIDG